ncbi:MAG: substrate-binding domain-containing protein [Christensenella sp.]|nr:substrate-binding domain-containing protein [Christensenella sp.]
MKKLIAFALTIVIALSALGCAAQTGTPDKAPSTETATGTEAAAGAIASDALIGIVLPTKEESRWLNDQKYFEEIFGGGNYNYEILFSQNNSANEKTNIETLLSKGAKIIVLCAYDATAAAAAVSDAKADGAIVISYDRLIMGTDKLDYYVTFDSRSVGKAQADYLIAQADGRKGINLYMYSGALTDNNSVLFFEGAWKALQPYIADGTFVVRNCGKAIDFKDKNDLSRDEMISIMQTIDSEWNMAICKGLAEAHLTAVGPESKGEVFVLGPADDDCCRALSDAFRADPEVTKLIITGADGVEASVQYIIDGKQSMTVFKDSQALVKGTKKIVDAVFSGEALVPDTTYNNEAMDVPTVQAEVVTVTADNIADVFFKTGVYDGSKFTGWN